MSNQSFTEIERQAQVAEKLREQQAADAKKQAEESMCVIAVVPLACVGVGDRWHGWQPLSVHSFQGCLHASGLPGAPD